ncbi:creatininase [Pseudomonas sp. SG-MS2]|uniref:M24 family metallopeptidase n=1 Tax=Pseudomonas TaxID=286 RepID=UPI000F789FBD|nr:MULTISPECIES: M24 family metallopeptidase [Pseudomonas]KAF1310814.1 creatininase [Pseudomonas sp. SG-MS2]RRV49598.1 M24 family metallopeptidase [Pseudomonas sp. p106]
MQMPQTLKIRNGNKAKPTFSAQEYAARHARLRAYMAEQDIEAAIFTSYHNVNYYSDFLYCSFGRPYALVVTHDKVVSISANIDGGQPWRRTVGTDNIVYTDWQRDNYFVAIQQALPLASRIGVEYDHLNLQNHAKLAACYPRAELLDIGAPCMRMRMIKSAEEQALIRHGARVADIGGAAVVEALQDQVPEYEVALHATQAMVREIARSFPDSELMDTWTWFQSGLNTDGAHNPVTSRKVNPGDILSLNCFPMIAGYYTALERTLFLGHCPDEHLRLWQANVEVHEAGLKLVRPGMRCCDIARELNEIFLRHDLLQYRTFGYGHSFGTLSHYYGREAGLELREDIDTVLEPGMVVSIEPMIMLPEGLPGAGGYREHDILIVNETGAENITKFPYGPERNIIRK